METPTCDVCKKSLAGKMALDLWILGTSFNREGEVAKTSLQVDTDKFPRDYLSVGETCCGPWVQSVWNDMINTLIKKG